MNKHQIVNAHWRHKESGTVIFVTQKSTMPQAFNYEREGSVNEVVKGFIGKSELKSNWERIEQ